MAVDHALADSAARSGEGALRFYRWSPPTISFGRNEPVEVLYDTQAASESGVAFVRRPTGGRAVLHDRELTYAITAPLTKRGGGRGFYREVNKGLLQGLRTLGAEVDLFEGEGRPPGPNDGPCFQAPVAAEVTWRGRKLIGSAQARLGKAVLQHGSLLLAGSQGLVATLRGDAPEPGDVTLSAVMGELPTFEALCEALLAGFQAVFEGEWAGGSLTTDEARAADALDERYRSEEWTWRR
jgi:lipoyl(octanoyl) transferase